MTKYHCKYCKKTVERSSDKTWIESFCEATGKKTRLWKVKKSG